MNPYSINQNNYGRWYVQERVSPTLSRIVKSDLTYAQARKELARLQQRCPVCQAPPSQGHKIDCARWG